MASTTTPTPTRAFFDAIVNRMAMLFVRWQDEHEYEDFADYCAEFCKMCEAHDMKFVRGTKRPFGFLFVHGEWEYEFKINMRRAEYCSVRRVKA